MNLIETLQQLVASKVDFVLVGGLAVALHGAVRGTMDVDIVLAMNDANLDRFIACAESMGLRPMMPVAMDSLKNDALLAQWHREKHLLAFSLRPDSPQGTVIDVLVRPEAAYEALATEAVEKDLAGSRVKIASVRHLIQFKRAAGRKIDLIDIDALETLQRERHG